MKLDAEKPIIFFDGYCTLCNGWLDFMLKRDKKSSLYFASLQGTTAKEQLEQEHLDTIDTIILKEGDTLYFQSSASLRAFTYLGGLYRLLYVLLVVPPFIRNGVYNIISRNRYQWLGKRETCRVPSEAESLRLLP